MANKVVYKPIETELGVISGRDAIFLDQLNIDVNHWTITLQGAINGHLCSKTTDEWINYKLCFPDVLSMKLFEIDAWDYSSSSSFDEVLKSEWLLSFGGNKTAEHKHYMVQTYDAVLEVICLEFELTFLDREQMQHDSV